MSTIVTHRSPTSAALLALALDHRQEAERAACLTVQRELYRIADIYTVLATMDMPMDAFARLVDTLP